ncbi:MAG: ComF family protein [Oscillospiraceae bacterium]|nr:ComF family protein [Oscillospiraceae bacterium]
MRKAYLYKRLILDMVYPNRCPFCDNYIPFDEYYCTDCRERLSPPPEYDDYANIDGFSAVTVYDDYSIPFIDKIKKESNGYALSAAAFMIFQSLASEKLLNAVDIITYVPMRRRDKLRRGYNQTAIIARELGQLADKPCKPLLKKVRDTSQQKTLGAADRRKNVKDAFAYRSSRDISGKTVLIIDDVCTTGSTLNEAASKLKYAGAKAVSAAVFAKTKKIT